LVDDVFVFFPNENNGVGAAAFVAAAAPNENRAGTVAAGMDPAEAVVGTGLAAAALKEKDTGVVLVLRVEPNVKDGAGAGWDDVGVSAAAAPSVSVILVVSGGGVLQ